MFPQQRLSERIHLQTGFLQRGSLNNRAAKFLGQCLYINVDAVLLQKIAHI